MKRLQNNQYESFILDHVIRPYQGLLGYEERIESLTFLPSGNPKSFNYSELIIVSHTNIEWFELVINRLSRCYEAIDFSFFPNEAFAQLLMKSLIKANVKPITRFNDVIYANA